MSRKIVLVHNGVRITDLEAYIATQKKISSKKKRNTRTCAECDVQPTFNFPGCITRKYCAMHKKEGMINLKKKRICKYIGCNIQPCFNVPGKISGIYCKINTVILQ
jgi:hypothetical protein